ncbi:hypothetical protein CC1G_00831 [Coprinopsis cinerea okayama7|uniref:Uncharacterized protein n=1 Tax=Coprinopsis cinerea (strain Okayama-7 / 130 / ATCC MYA-4618 / FGSC 9003) TaxID=240176 RepID=A8N8V6_COPC7|nr:hypothetical protein CC1G_00831 [Coprinopsis cinerea okayama7\|eukprot:XP_001831284.2 hypothetical protein CC1G_00831 [Coprinopsis cinerea okayama7\
MANIGSAFLGDRQRRHFSSSTTHTTSTPPSSPPPTGVSGMIYPGRASTSPLAMQFDNDDLDDTTPGESSTTANTASEKKQDEIKLNLPPAPPPKPIDPRLALELRVRWLEAIVYGTKQDVSNPTTTTRLSRPAPPRKGKQRDLSGLKDGETLMRLAENVQQRLEAAVDGNEGLKKFMSHYDQHSQYLTSAFALSGLLSEEDPSSAYSNMTPEEIDAFLTEMEPEIRAADRDMQEIEALVNKGVTGAGKLPDHEKLQSRLESLLEANKADIELAASLEKRIATLMQKHARSVDALSELFVSWDDALTMAEDSIIQIEKDKRERRRLGLE